MNDLYNRYKDLIAVLLVLLAVVFTLSYNFVGQYEETHGLDESAISGWRSLRSFVFALGNYLALFLLSLASFVAWPRRTNRVTKSIMGVITLYFLVQTIRVAFVESDFILLEALVIVFIIGLILFLIFLGKVMFTKVDSTDYRLLVRTMRKNKELQELIYKISHDAFMAEASRAKGWLELIKLKKNEIHDPELLKYLDGLDATFTNMRKKTNTLMKYNPDKFKDFVDSDFNKPRN